MADKPFIISKDLQVGDGSAAGTTDALLRVDDTNNRVGINTPTPTGTLDVTVASSGDRGLIVRSVSSQTTKSFEILGANSSGVFSIDPSGSVYFAPWSGTQTSSIKYDASSNGLVFTGSGTSANPIELNVLSDSTLSFEGTAGQLFSVADGLSSGTIFAVSDISGMPSLEIDASGLIKLGEFDGFVGVGTSQTYGQYSGKMEINYPSGYKGLIVRPGSAEIRNALEVQNASSGTVFSVDPYGATVIDLTTSTTSKGLIIQAAASQSVNLQEWQDSSSTVLASVNQEGRFSGVSYNASSGVILQSSTPASTTNTLYNVSGSLYFNGSAVGGSISTLTFGSGLSGSTSSTFDGTSAVTVNLGGTGTLSQLRFTSNQINIGSIVSPPISSYDYINIGLSAGYNSSGNQYGINIGRQAGYNAKSHGSSISIGLATNQSSSGINDSIAIGISAGYSSNNVLSSVYIGSYAGYISTGNYNTYIGTYAGYYASGNNNIEITASGSSSNILLSGLNSNKINIGSTIAGDISNKKLAIGNVSSSNLSPNSTVEILPKETTDKSLILKGTSSYATNFLEVQDSSSTANLYIDQNYNLVTTGNVVANSGAFNVLDLTPIPDTNYPAYQEGLVFYDDENKSLTVYNDEADISLQLGQETYLRVRNDSGSGILNGQLVYISGSQGTHPQVGLAIANCVYKSQAVGMATHDIEDSSFGYVTTYGIVRGLDTSGYGSGLPVYLSPTVSGGYTLTAAEPPYFNVHVGHVIRGDSASNGSILIEMESPKFAGLDITTTSGNINISGVPFYSVSGCAGVAMVTDPSFYYDSGNGKLVFPTGQVREIRSSDTNVRFLGSGTIALPTTLTRSVIAGYNYYDPITLATDSVYLGTNVGSSISGIQNIGIGYYAGAVDTLNGSIGSGNYNIYIGDYAGFLNDGDNNLILNPKSPYGNAGFMYDGSPTTYSNIIDIAETIVGSSSTKRLAIGNVSSSNFSPNATLEVLPSTTTTKGVIVKGAVSQSANLQEWQTSDGSIISRVSSAGKIGINTTTPNAWIQVTPSGNNETGIYIDWNGKTGTQAIKVNQYGIDLLKAGMTAYGDYAVSIGAMYSSHGLKIYDGYSTGGYAWNALTIENTPTGGVVFNVGFNGKIITRANSLNLNSSLGYTNPQYSITNGTYAGQVFKESASSYNFIWGEYAAYGGSTNNPQVTGSNNFIWGYGAFANPTGTSHGNFAWQSMANISYGSYNFYWHGGANLKVGSYNINLGQAGMTTLATGDYNIALGQGTVFPATASYSIALGRAATVDKSNQLVIGSTSYKIGGSSSGESGVTNTSPGYLSKLLEAKINGTYYNIPLLPSGSTNVAFSGTIGVNTTSPGASLEVDALSSTTKGVIVKGAVSQSANLQEWQNSDGTRYVSIDKIGKIYQAVSGVSVVGIGNDSTLSTWYSNWNRIVAIGHGAGENMGSAGLNVAIGTNAMAGVGIYNNNVAVGDNAMASTANALQYCVAVGDSALKYASGAAVGIGASALMYVVGGGNTAVGHSAGANVINGTYNTLLGNYAGSNITTGSSNVIIGTLSNNKNISNSVIIGHEAGQISENSVVAVGYRALWYNQYGVGNTAVGVNAGSQPGYYASYNTFVGYGTTCGSDQSGVIAIGYGATASNHYQLALGSSLRKIGKSDGTGEESVTSATPSGISKLLQANINGTVYKIPLLPSGATDLQTFSALSVSGGIEMPSGIPATTTNKLYASGSTLYFNGTEVGAGGGGGSLSGGASGYIPIWDSASSLTYDSSLAYSTSGKYFTYTGTGVSANPMKMKILDDSTLSFESTDGQLFSISDGLQSGRIFAVNDISGMPFIEVDASGLVKIAEYDGVVGIGTSQTYGQYSGKVEITYPSGLGGLISRPASGAPGNALEVQTFSSGTVFTVSQSGTISSTLQGATSKGLVVKAGTSQTANLIELQDSAGTPILTISPSGSISGAIAPGIITTSSSPYSLTDAHHGKIVEYTGTSSGTFNIGTITIPGWNCMLVNLESGILVGANGNTLYSPGSASGTRTKYSSLSLYYRGSNTFVLGGDLA